jgi:Uma2 family endonuclease
MSLMVNDPAVADEMLAKRRAQGADRFDEVWEDVYMMVPAPNNEHQELTSELTAVLRHVVDWNGLGRTLAGANVSDRTESWTSNYRVPDVAVFLESTKAIDRQTHWHGGPDLAIEIVSPGDQTYEKLEFYARVNTGELLIIDRHPWKLTLYRLSAQSRLEPASVCTFDQQHVIASTLFPIQFQLNANSLSLDLLDNGGQLIRAIRITR